LNLALKGKERACRRVAQLLLKKGVTVDLSSAVRLGDAARVRELTVQDPESVRRIAGPHNVLNDAILFSGSREIVELLLDAGVEVNPPQPEGTSPLFVALEFNPGLVEPLLRHGADANARSSQGESALRAARRRAAEGGLNLVPLLLAHGAVDDEAPPLSPEEQALLQEAAARPDADAPRLRYADWLQGQGDLPRAEFVRVQCVLAALGDDGERQAPLAARARALLDQHRSRWLRPLLALGVKAEAATFRRGLVEAVVLEDFDLLLVRGDALFRAAPALQEVAFQNAVSSLAGCRLDAGRLAATPYLSRLTALTLFRCDIRAEGAGALADSAHVARLTRLLVLKDPLGDAGARALAGSPRLGGLTWLTLEDCGVGPEGAQALAASPYLTGLGVLHLGGNPLGPLGALALAASQALPQLTELSVSRRAVGRRGQAALRRRFGDRVTFV
jgi:uncharacterized protein (TIGR02996 family)